MKQALGVSQINKLSPTPCRNGEPITSYDFLCEPREEFNQLTACSRSRLVQFFLYAVLCSPAELWCAALFWIQLNAIPHISIAKKISLHNPRRFCNPSCEVYHSSVNDSIVFVEPCRYRASIICFAYAACCLGIVGHTPSSSCDAPAAARCYRSQ